MLIHIIIVSLIIIIFVIGIIYITTYNRFQDYIIRINEVESKIDDNLRDKFDYILKLNNIIKEKIKTSKKLVDDLNNLKDENISSFDMDRKLVEALNKVIFVKDKYDELDGDEEVSKILYNIEDIDESIRACKKYYNEQVKDYNILIRKLPYNIIGKLLKYNEKTYFDGKNMNDENINDFKM